MNFASPQYFWLLVLVPVFVLGFLLALRRRKSLLKRFGALDIVRHLVPPTSVSWRIFQLHIFILGLLFLILALTRPQFGIKEEEVKRRGVDIIVALDISKSMLAEDVVPNRIDRAKHEVSKLIRLLRGDRIGLIIFAGQSYVQCPLTLDYATAQLFLSAVKPDWIDVAGTAIGEAIQNAISAFETQENKHKVLLVISDGEDHLGEAVKAAEQANKKGIIVHTIGIGSEQGSPIPLKTGGSNVRYKKDSQGNVVMSKLNPAMLEEIAIAGGGSYFASSAHFKLDAVYEEINKLEKKDFDIQKAVVYEERYQLFLFIALILLGLEMLFPLGTIKHREAWRGRLE